MPRVVANGVELSYHEAGDGPETIVFSHSYLLDWTHFRPQVEHLSDRFRCIAYDHRDHGGSERMARRYHLGDLVEDGIGLIEALDLAPCHWVGLSTGGFVGMRIARRRPELLRSLVLMDTSADAEAWHKKLQYQAMFAILRLLGPRPLMGEIMRLFFAKKIRSDKSRRAELDRWRSLIASRDPGATIRFGNAIFAREPHLDELGGIELPTLVMAGEEDRAVPRGSAERMAEAIEGAQLVLVPGAAHLPTVEEPDAVNRALDEHLAGLP